MANLISARFGTKCAEHCSLLLISSFESLWMCSLGGPSSPVPLFASYATNTFQATKKKHQNRTELGGYGEIIIFNWRTQVFAIPEIVIIEEGCLTLWLTTMVKIGQIWATDEIACIIN